MLGNFTILGNTELSVVYRLQFIFHIRNNIFFVLMQKNILNFGYVKTIIFKPQSCIN